MNEPHCWSATETVEALRKRRIGAVELLDHMTARQQRLDGPLNAVIATDLDTARAAAQAADKASAPLGPLHGLPMTIKETYDVTGFATTAGIPDLAHNRPTRDADAVARLRKAGAVIWGKTNVPVAAADHQSVNPIYGLTCNPWDLERTPGGSSGGAAAAVAGGFTALELGSDIGGSIRLPAHFCGVWGLKPSYGIVSGRGHIPPGPGALAPSPLGVSGPLGRSAKDLSLALDVLAGGGPGAWQLSLPASRHQRLADFRIAVWTGGYPVDTAYAAGIDSYANSLAGQGAQVTVLDTMPSPLKGADDLYLKLLFAVLGAGSPPDEVAGYAAVAAAHPDIPIVQLIARSVTSSMADVAQLFEAQAQTIAAWDGWFKEYDAVLMPVSMGQAFPHMLGGGFGPVSKLPETLDVGGKPESYLKNLLWPGIATFAHLPAVACPIPGGINGLPAGVQIMGPAFGDRTVLKLAELCEEAVGGFTVPPGFE
ncbi:amidase family protein [Pararhodobacter zhoushanensis]|uniref:Amidase family protein n=1 Tax=Pararhodobacter zhoushanensis TaxID=2479545 RepID=A0ABT3H575_9RHOB|nr:amidase family protein [Pararhodobacter zhoushanensis]MCW1934908.1 amidase family protein [Pararhodobacter zhoushanensis]